jgi:hypothetical protein
MRHHQKLQEFGDIQSKDFYEALQLISPYHIPYKVPLITDLLLTVDEAFPFNYHTRKLIAKLRQVMAKDKRQGFVFMKEFSDK